MKLLVTGAGGLLGSNVVTSARSRDWSVVGTYHSSQPALDISLEQLDIRNAKGVKDLLGEHQPDAVVNCAAMTDVDACEANPEQAYAVNGNAPGKLASICEDGNIAFCHISTDYIFDGRRDTPYPETAAANPLQVYGKSKRRGEKKVLTAGTDVLVPRLSFVWGIHRSTEKLTGFPAWVRNRLVANEAVPLFTDQHITPTRAGAAATKILDLIDQDTSGVVHVAARSCVTPYGFGQVICDKLDGNSTLLEEGSQSDVHRPAERPRYTCLDVSRIECLLDARQPSLSEDLETVGQLL